MLPKNPTAILPDSYRISLCSLNGDEGFGDLLSFMTVESSHNISELRFHFMMSSVFLFHDTWIHRMV